MSVIDLTHLSFADADPVPVRFGGVQDSDLGGASEYVGGLGDRWAFAFQTVNMPVEPQARLLLADLTEGLSAGVLVRVRQPDFDFGAPGAPTVRSTTASGRTIPIEGASPNAVIRKGAWLNYFGADGQRYLDHTRSEVIVDGAGEADLPIANLLRAPLAEGANVVLGRPCILGSIRGFEGGKWGANRMTSFGFTVREDR